VYARGYLIVKGDREQGGTKAESKEKEMNMPGDSKNSGKFLMAVLKLRGRSDAGFCRRELEDPADLSKKKRKEEISPTIEKGNQQQTYLMTHTIPTKGKGGRVNRHQKEMSVMKDNYRRDIDTQTQGKQQQPNQRMTASSEEKNNAAWEGENAIHQDEKQKAFHRYNKGGNSQTIQRRNGERTLRTR